MAFVDPNPQAFRDPLTELTLIMLTITRQLAFDAGHRIPDHQSRCRNLHGHRYVLEITLQGSVIKTQGAPDCGMVMDFAEVKTLAMRHLVEAWDHAFLVYQDDARVRAFLETMPEHKTVIINRIPTAENLAAIAFERLAGVYDAHYGISDTDLSHAEAGFTQWIQAGYHGEMDYMVKHGSKRTRPAELVPGAQRVISVRMPYLPAATVRGQSHDWRASEHAKLAEPDRAVVSMYARGRDYHKV